MPCSREFPTRVAKVTRAAQESQSPIFGGTFGNAAEERRASNPMEPVPVGGRSIPRGGAGRLAGKPELQSVPNPAFLAGKTLENFAFGRSCASRENFSRALLTLRNRLGYTGHPRTVMSCSYIETGLPHTPRTNPFSRALTRAPHGQIPPDPRFGRVVPDRLQPRNSRLVLLWRENLPIPGTRMPLPRWGGP